MRRQRPSLTAAYQYLYLSTSPICGGTGTLRAGTLTWRFVASPTAFSRTYRLRIEYRQDTRPRVLVDAPDLNALAEGRAVPHVYSEQPLSLCLYFPSAGEWTSDMRLDQTVVPWAIVWLFYFEEWLVSNEWKGGGTHPGGKR